MFIMRKALPTELVGAFTPTETDRITTLRQEFRRFPDQFKLDISFRRLEFARWLMAHGYLDEWCERRVDPMDQT